MHVRVPCGCLLSQSIRENLEARRRIPIERYSIRRRNLRSTGVLYTNRQYRFERTQIERHITLAQTKGTASEPPFRLRLEQL